MTTSLIIDGTLHAPYFIFLKCAGFYSDADFLQRFGLGRYGPTEAAPRTGPYAILADHGEWVLLADDWHYTLWHMPSTRRTIASLAEICDVFACSVGDCDRSFDFVYYRHSQLVRKHVVADPDFRGGVVVEDIGEPLPGESAAMKHSDEMRVVLEIAASLGIKTDYTEADLRLYAPSRSKTR